MTSTASPTLALRDAHADAVRAIGELSGAAGGESLAIATDEAVAECLVDLFEIRRRLEATIADVSARFSGGTTWSAEGFRTARDWLRARTTDGLGPASRALEGAHWMRDFPVITEAWRSGAVSRAHVEVLADAHEMFPRLSEAFVGIEPELTAHACGVDPASFRRILFAQLHLIDPDAIDEADAKKRRNHLGLHVSRLTDGFVRVDGLLAPEVGQHLLTMLAAARDALRAKNDSPTDDPFSSDYVPRPIADDPQFPRESKSRLSARNAEALSLILDAAASALGDNRLPDTGGERPVVHITVDAESLIENGAQAPGWITGLTGTQVTAITERGAQRLSCDAVAELLVVDKRGHLDAISTRWRTAPPGMRRYVLMREHGRCRFPGCHTQIREVHHIIHWANGGPTETSNLVGLCSHHHHLVHEGGWTLSGHPDHTLIFTDRLKRTWRSDPPHRE